VASVVLKARKAGPFYGRHPWVLDSAIDRVDGDVDDGDVVELITPKGDWIARGIYNSHSRIRVRLYTWLDDEILDADFWRRRIEQAVALRRDLHFDDSDGAARVIFSEADGLSGLIVDRYGPYLVVQVGALAIQRRLPEFIEWLVEALRPRGIVLRTEKGIADREGINLENGPFWGEVPDGPIIIREHGIQYGVDLCQGQKTGFYLDQRENRRVAASYFAGRRVLDLFCYTGGFSLAARQLGDAREVLGIDTSSRAVQLARENAKLNGITGVRFETGDAKQYCKQLREQSKSFDVVVLDPPKFAQSRRSVDAAMRAYQHINQQAVELLPAGGILVTCSCSGYITREDFDVLLAGVSRRSGRRIQILESRGASPDHPVNVSCLESEYLKCLICRVE